MLLLILLTLGVMATPQTLSASDVIQRVQDQDPTLDVSRDRVALRQAQQMQASSYPNPQYNWTREHLVGETEEAHLLSIPVQLSSTRRSKKLLAQSQVATAQALASSTSTQVVAHALTLFYQTLALTKRSHIEEEALQRLTEATRILRRQQEEGSVSGYDLMRVETAMHIAASRLRQTQNQEKRLRAELYARLGMTDTPQLVGSLNPNPDIVAQTSLTDSNRQSLRMLNEAMHYAERARAAARWAWMPSLNMTGGIRQDRLAPERNGYQMGVAVNLPIFSHGRALRSQSQARHSLTRNQATAAVRDAHIGLRDAQTRLLFTREEIDAFNEAMGDRSQRLEKAAQSGYLEGSFSIVELLDAQQAKTDLDLYRLDLLHAAKQAEVDYCSARGDYE